MTDVKQELPNLRDQIPREWLLVSAMMGARSATLADILRILPLLEPEQQWAIEEALHLAGADTRTRLRRQIIAAEADRDAAIKRAEEAEASLAHMVKCAHACDEVDAENEKLREQLAGMTDAHASAQSADGHPRCKHGAPNCSSEHGDRE